MFPLITVQNFQRYIVSGNYNVPLLISRVKKQENSGPEYYMIVRA
jgi:hypothetical protein